MALESLWVTLRSGVTDVSAVQPSIHAGYGCNGTETATVTDVTNMGYGADGVTAVTAAKMHTLQRKPAPVLACTAVTAVTAEKINTGANAANDQQQPDPDRHCHPLTDACNSVELALMATRLERFARIGMDVDLAERQADKLLIRDREDDARAMCLECANLSGGTGNWRCMAFRQRGARDQGLPHDMIGMLTRCPTFVAGEPSTSSSYTPARPANDTRLVQRDRAQGPWLTASESAAAQEYHQHHATCPQCQAAGRGYSSRCDTGQALWNKYQEGTTE